MRNVFSLLLIALITLFSLNGIAQTTISGKITDVDTGEPLIGVNIIVKGTTIGTITDIDGNFNLDVKEGSEIEVSYTGYTTTIDVTGKTNIDIALETGISLDEIVVSASRRPEKVINAPSSISVISSKRIENTSVANPLQYMKNTAGVSVSEHSAGRMFINLRGQVSTNFTGIYVARDYKPLTQPGNGGFFSSDHPLSSLDIERLEVVRGPGSALYGPGVTNGVVHFITKDPFKHAGTSVELGLNTVNTFGGFGYSGAVRHAGHNEDGTFGYKVNAYYINTDEWEYDIYNDTLLANTLGRTRGIDEIRSAETGEVLVSGILEDGFQDYFRNYNVDGALYFKKPQSRDNLVIAGGYTKTDQVWLTTNNPSLRRPNSFFTQARGTLGNTFATISYTSIKSGDNKGNAEAFYRATTRDEEGVRNIALTQAQQYDFTEAQVQHRLLFSGLNNTELLVGGEARLLNVGGGIFGRFTGETPYNLFGGYLQSKTPLVADKLDMTLALRYDYYSVLSDFSLAPRVAFVYKPNDSGAFRLSYNQAYNAPSAINFYVDLILGPVNDDLGNALSWIRLVSSKYELHTFENKNIAWGGTASALGSGSGLALSHADAIVTAANAAGVSVDASSVSATSDLSNNIVNTRHNAATIVDATPLQLQQNQTYEAGYSGKVIDNLKLNIDLYYNNVKNAQAVNTDYSRYISNDGLADAVKGSASSLGLSGADLDSLNAAIDGLFAGNKVATVISDIQLADEELAAGNSGSPYTFRQYFSAAAIDYFGYDIQLEYAIDKNWDVALAYSGLSNTDFEDDNDLRYLLNTPQNRFRGSVGYSTSGFSTLLDLQWQQAFEILNGTFSGPVDARATVDLNFGYKVNENFGVTLAGLNILNNEYQAFPGSYRIGTQFVLKARYDF